MFLWIKGRLRELQKVSETLQTRFRGFQGLWNVVWMGSRGVPREAQGGFMGDSRGSQGHFRIFQRVFERKLFQEVSFVGLSDAFQEVPEDLKGVPGSLRSNLELRWAKRLTSEIGSEPGLLGSFSQTHVN